MAEPSLGDVHVDAALTDFSLAYFQDPGSFLARQVFPIIGSPKQSNKYHTYDKYELNRTVAQKRAPNTEAAVRTYKLSTDQFYCDVYSIAVDVSEQVRSNADPVLDPEEDAARVTVQDINIMMDRDWNTVAMTTGVWGTDSTGSTGVWNGTGDPINDVSAAKLAVLKATGRDPNTMVIGANAYYEGLANHADVIARLPDNSPRITTPEFLQTLFGVDRVFIARSIYSTVEKGSTGQDTDFAVTGDQALLAYVDPNPGPRTPTAGATFVWSGLVGGGGGIRTKRMDMPWQDAVPRVETDVAFDFKVTGSDLGYLLHNLIT